MILRIALEQIQKPTWWFEDSDREFTDKWKHESGKVKKDVVLKHIRQAGRADCAQIRRATGYTTQSIRYVTVKQSGVLGGFEMNREEIIAAAKEAGFFGHRQGDWSVCTTTELERFAAIMFEKGCQAERKECAKVCENNYWSEEIDWWLRATKKDISAKAARKCAAAIRARGEVK